MAQGTLTPAPYETVLDANGNPLSGALINTYIAGTTTPIATYSDVNLTTPNANPIVADSSGRWLAYLTPGASYKYVITDSSGGSVRTVDNILAVPTSTSNFDVTGTAGETLTAGQAVYLSDGSGGKVAGSWYKADSANTYSSTLPQIGMVPSTIASGSTGTIREAGSVPGLSALTIGPRYYVGTAGAITLVAPANARYIGNADTTSSLIVVANPPAPTATIDNNIMDGALTLTSGLPYTTADVIGATTIYYTPNQGNRIALYDGTNWAVITFTETTQALGTVSSGKPYDVFGFNNAGTLNLEILAWTNDSTRAVALTTQDGVLVKTGFTTRRYLGSFYTTSTTQTEDSAQNRYVYNLANVPRSLFAFDSTVTWNYTTLTYRLADNSTSNQINVMVGYANRVIELTATANATNTNTGVRTFTSIGADSTTAAAASASTGVAVISTATASTFMTSSLRTIPAAGRHFYTKLEASDATGTTSWNGNGGSFFQSSFMGVIH